MPKFSVVDFPGKPVITLTFTDSPVEINIFALDRLINFSDLSFRRVAEILGISDLELEETIQDLADSGDIRING